MMLCRHQIVTRIFALVTGVVFLNMSFFLAEVCLLDFQDRQMIENVCNLVINGGLEEERDSHSGGGDAPQKIFPLIGDKLLLRHSSLFLIACKIYTDSEDHYLHADHSETFSPPPDFIPSFS